MLASCVAFPALTVLLFQFQVMFHVVHEPAREGIKNTCHITQSAHSFLYISTTDSNRLIKHYDLTWYQKNYQVQCT